MVSNMRYEVLGGSVIRLNVADSFSKRLKGLMFCKSLDIGHALLLTDCPQVHTCFMRFPIDVVYLSPDYTVLDIQYALKPWRVGKNVDGTRHILELFAGSTAIEIGTQLLKEVR